MQCVVGTSTVVSEAWLPLADDTVVGVEEGKAGFEWVAMIGDRSS